MTDCLKFLNSLKFFGALAECPKLLKAFSRSIKVFMLSLSFVTLCHRFAHRFNSPSIWHRCELGIQSGKELALEEPERFQYQKQERYALGTRTVPVPKCMYSESALV